MGGSYMVYMYGTNTTAVYTLTPPNSVHIFWLIPQYIILTVAEILFSITSLEFAYSQVIDILYFLLLKKNPFAQESRKNSSFLSGPAIKAFSLSLSFSLILLAIGTFFLIFLKKVIFSLVAHPFSPPPPLGLVAIGTFFPYIKKSSFFLSGTPV